MLQDGKTDLRQLGHDLRNHLFMIELGLQTLEIDRTPVQLTEILGKIRKELSAAEKIADALQETESESPEL